MSFGCLFLPDAIIQPNLDQSAAIHADRFPDRINFINQGLADVQSNTDLLAGFANNGLGKVYHLMDIFPLVKAPVKFFGSLSQVFLSHIIHFLSSEIAGLK